MNRSTIGDYFEKEGFTLHYVNKGSNNNTYHVYRKPSDWSECLLICDYFYISHVYEVFLCTNELLVYGRFGELKVNIPYKHLTNLEVRGFE